MGCVGLRCEMSVGELKRRGIGVYMVAAIPLGCNYRVFSVYVYFLLCFLAFFLVTLLLALGRSTSVIRRYNKKDNISLF